MSKYEFPWPPFELSPNARVHWRTLAQAKRQYKDACGWIIRGANERGILFWSDMLLASPVTAQVTFVVTDKRRRDTDNHLSMLKVCFDAFVDMGVLEDDSRDALRIAEPKWERGPEKKVIVELSPFHDGSE